MTVGTSITQNSQFVEDVCGRECRSLGESLKKRSQERQPVASSTQFARTYSFGLPSTAPPSIGITAPFKWLPARLARYTTNAAISSGLPSLPFGFSFAIASCPPFASIKPFAIFEGKKPGAMALQTMCRGPSSTARFFVRWMTAAFEAA